MKHIFNSASTEYADVVLPTTAFGEEECSFTSTDRRIQLAEQAIVPPTILFFFSSRRRHTSYIGDWSSDVCSSDLPSSSTSTSISPHVCDSAPRTQAAM